MLKTVEGTRDAPGAAPTTDAVVLEGISKSFSGPSGSHVVIDDLNLTVASGEFFSLLGPSGCGKTTTLRLIAGLEQPDAGRVVLAGRDATGVPAHSRGVNTVFQNYALFPHLNVFDNVAYGLRRHSVDRPEVRRRVRETLALVHMDGYELHRPRQLSGGQQQRIALARAVVNRPTVLLLDEPLAALDLKLREAMQEELKRLQRELAMTFVFVTHDQSEAFAMSDRVAVMDAGRLVQIGTPEDLYLAPLDRFVATFVGRANFIPLSLVEATGEVATRFLAADAPATTVIVRPERLTLSLVAERPAGRPGLGAVVTDRTFAGGVTSVRLRAGEVELLASCDSASPVARVAAPGESLWVSGGPPAAPLASGEPSSAGVADGESKGGPP
ncbi:MAG TPA: ABC transporter ATP-binding protein [Acidimicrobiales bacterium]|nr:ABC transporter ATP-binding protein [Acidimicrobiales bacterium]